MKQALEKTTIFLDFDGVLMDSVKEAYLLARYAYFGISPLTYIKDEEYKKFYYFRYLVTKSWQYYYIFELISAKISNEDFEEKYYQLINKYGNSKAVEFDKRFVTQREVLINENFEFWDNLDAPYPFFEDIKELSKNPNYNIYVLTNKKRLPVQNKLNKYNLQIKLYANEDLQNFETKAEFIKKYIDKYNLPEAFLVEDSYDNIKQCRKYPQIKPLLVNWGYVNPNKKGLDKNEIIYTIKGA